MNTDPKAFLENEVFQLFDKGVQTLRDAVEAGEAGAQTRLEDILEARGAVRICLEGPGGSDFFVMVGEGKLQMADSAGQTPTRLSFGIPAAGLQALLEEVSDDLDDSDLLEGDSLSAFVAMTASAEAERLLEGEQLEFYLNLRHLPIEPSELTLRVGLGVAEPPQDPQFTVSISWDDVEDVRDGEMDGRQLFGRLKITGDAGRAMALGMKLMQRRQS